MKTLQDIKLHQPNEPMLSRDWSVKNAIIDRVQQEDFLRWATEDEVRGLIGELYIDAPTPLSLFTFVKGILP